MLKSDEALSLFSGHQYAQNRSVLTVSAYQTDLVQFFRFAALELGLESEMLTVDLIDVYIVRGYLGVLADYGLARKSMARKLAALRSFFKFLCRKEILQINPCLLYTSDAADEEDSVDLGGRRIIKKKKNKTISLKY